MFEKNTELKNSLLISPFFMIIICAGLFLIFIKPKFDEISSIRDNIAQEQERLKKLTEKAAFLRSLDEDFIKQEIKILETALPSEKDVPSFMSTVNLLAQEASISVNTIQLSPGKISTASSKISRGEKIQTQDSTEGKLPINLTIEGTYDNVKNFIVRMAKAMPLQTVQSIDFARTGNEKGVFGVVASNFVLSIHYRVLPKTLGKVSDPVDKVTPEEESLLAELVNYTQPLIIQTFIPVGREDPFARP